MTESKNKLLLMIQKKVKKREEKKYNLHVEELDDSIDETEGRDTINDDVEELRLSLKELMQ